MINHPLNIHHHQQPGSDLHWASASTDSLSTFSGADLSSSSSRSLKQGSYNQGVSNLPEWDWQSQQQQMLLAHFHNNSNSNMHDLQDSGERKLSGDPLMNLQNFPYSSTRFPQHSQLLFGALGSYSAGSGGGYQGPSFGVTQQSLHVPYASFAQAPNTGVVSSITGLEDFRQFRDLRTLEQRKRLYGLLDMDPGSYSIKQERGRYTPIGLNLGVRTYFSAEDLTVQNRMGKRARANFPAAPVPLCQAEGCKADLNTAKHYHRRHKVCELHSKAATVTANGQTQRFCQQCSRFHPLGEFDEGKRSCRKRLADHNRRRRKPQQVPAPAAAGDNENEDGGGAGNAEEVKQPPGTPTSSQEHSDNNSLSKSSHSENKSSGAHSTLFDRPPAVDTANQSDLMSALSASSALGSIIRPPMNQQKQHLLQKLEQNLMKPEQNHLSAEAELIACLSSSSSSSSFISSSSWLKPVEPQISAFRNPV